jgi:hypothetical protein
MSDVRAVATLRHHPWLRCRAEMARTAVAEAPSVPARVRYVHWWGILLAGLQK